jgi:EAL domain-containing protein (putative c-di-GMP-specific phosphodiesterase class I)
MNVRSLADHGGWRLHAPLHWRVRAVLWCGVTALATGVALGAGPLPAMLVLLPTVVLAWMLGEPTVRAVQCLADAPSPAPSAAVAQVMAVHYRPLLALADGHTAAVEAALHGHPVQGSVQALDAGLASELPAALADSLCQTLADTACRQFVRWPLGTGTFLVLRLPPALLAAPHLVPTLQHASHGAGLAAGRLRAVVSLAAPSATATALALHRAGIGLVLDGFGSGDASLALLNELPLDAVRLDRSYVDRAGHSALHRLVVESTVRLAATRGMLTVADGIDNPDQAAALAALGCDLGQGEHCGPWLDPEAWTRRWAAGTDNDAD